MARKDRVSDITPSGSKQKQNRDAHPSDEVNVRWDPAELDTEDVVIVPASEDKSKRSADPPRKATSPTLNSQSACSADRVCI